MFGASLGLFGFGGLGLLTAIAGLVLGVFMLILDFDFVEQGIANRLPERESWRAAFAMTVSLVWIYTNLLRLLAIFSQRLIAHGTTERPRASARGSGRRHARSAGRPRRAPRRSSRGLALGLRVAAAVPQLDPQPAHAAARAARPRCRRARCRGCSTACDGGRGDRQHALAAERLGLGLVVGDQAERGQRRGQQHGGQRAVAVGRRVELVGAEQQRGRGRELRARGSSPARRCGRPPRATAMVWAAASRRDQVRATCLSGGAIGLIVPRSGQVPTTTSTPASRRRRTPSERWRTEAAGSTVWVTSLAPIRITATSGSIGSARSIWRVEVGGRRADHGELAQVDPPVGPLGQAAGEQRAGGLLDPVDAVPGGAGVAEQRDLERRAGAAAAVPAGGVGRRLLADAPIARRASLASAVSTPYRPAPSTDRPPPPKAAADASLRAAPAFPTRSLYGRTAAGGPRWSHGAGQALDWPDAVRELAPRPHRQHPAAEALARPSHPRRPRSTTRPGRGPLVLAKVEYLNPGGSVKDRIATRMIEAAEASGELQPGGTIVEPTSGNTGVGLAMVAQAKGYKCVFVCPDKVSEDKRNVLKAYGAEVVVCPTAVAPEHPDSYYNVSDRLSSQPGAWKPDQYSNPNNPRSHYETTGPEIWAQTEGRITHFVVRRRHRRHDQRHRPLPQGAEPRRPGDRRRPGRLGLLRRHRPPLPRRGRRRGLLARLLRPRRRRPDHRGLRRRLLRLHPPAGPRGGAAGRRLVRDGGVRREAARPRAGRHPRGRGRRDRGAAARLRPRLPHQGLQRRVARRSTASRSTARPPATRQTVGEVLRGKDGRLPDLVHTHPSETIAEAVAHPPGVRRLADARGPRRAADRGRRGGGLGLRARPCSTRCSPAPPSSPTRSRTTCPRRCRRSARPSRPATRSSCSRAPTRCSSTRTASPSACSPGRTCWRSCPPGLARRA